MAPQHCERIPRHHESIAQSHVQMCLVLMLLVLISLVQIFTLLYVRAVNRTPLLILFLSIKDPLLKDEIGDSSFFELSKLAKLVALVKRIDVTSYFNNPTGHINDHRRSQHNSQVEKANKQTEQGMRSQFSKSPSALDSCKDYEAKLEQELELVA